jgi:hypothetical protein
MARWFAKVVCLFATSATLALWVGGCGSACEDLANKVCNCQPTRAKKDRCKLNVDAAVRNFDLSDEEEDRCEKILDSGRCTCEALAAGEHSACGLSSDPSVALD